MSWLTRSSQKAVAGGPWSKTKNGENGVPECQGAGSALAAEPETGVAQLRAPGVGF